MRIAIDIREATGQKTGKGWYTFVMVKNLLKNDTQNSYILYTQTHNSKFDKYENATQRVIKKNGLLWHLAVLRDLKKNPPDIFWAPTSYIIPAFLPKTIVSMITIHDLIAFLFPLTHNKKAVLLERFTVPRAVKKAHTIFTVSHNTEKDVEREFDVSREKIVVAQCGVSKIFHPLQPHEIEPICEKFKVPEHFILGVGTLSPRKNFDRLIEAYAQISDRHPSVHLVIVGEKGWKWDVILERAKIAKDRVHFIGYVEGEEVAALYNKAKLFVFPSLYEGFGMPPLEAMACGCPVITSDRSSLPEVVGEAALQVNPYSVDEIAKAMDQILSDPTLAHTLVKKGFAQAEKFRWEDSAKKMLKAFMLVTNCGNREKKLR